MPTWSPAERHVACYTRDAGDNTPWKILVCPITEGAIAKVVAHDVVVLGTGAAGLTAATVLAAAQAAGLAANLTANWIESLLSARRFREPQLAGEKLIFVSNLAGHLSLYAMPIEPTTEP